MSSKNFKHDLFNQFALVAKAMANGNRLQLLEYLAQGERSVDELSKLAGLTVANTSQHLQHLRHAGLISTRKQGLKVYSYISGEDVIDMLNALRIVAERHVAEVERLVNTYLTVKDSLEPIRRDELLQRARDGLVTVIDVRTPEEFAAGHVTGAVNIPLHELEERLDELAEAQQIVAYCRGPYCVLAFDAVACLREKGLNARRLDGGYPEWKAAGLPIDHDCNVT